MVQLMKASMKDCSLLHKMQVLSFQSLLEKYKDVDTNPGAESIERVKERMKQVYTDYYLISVQKAMVGGIRIIRLQNDLCRISPMFILPEFQGNGYAQEVIKEIERLYPQTIMWTLDTIKEESLLCHLYEKMGYKATGKEEKLQENLTIKYYCKQTKNT